MNDLESMKIFMRVAELASFTQAADSLGLPKASVSTAVSSLENSVGTRLLQRTTRTVQLTPDGKVYYERCQDLLADFDELQSMFGQVESDLSGRLRIDMPVGVARTLILPHLPEFLSMHPKLDVEFSCTDRRVDVIREGFDCVLRVGALVDSNLIARPLGEYVLINCASKTYLKKFGTPESLEDLDNHRLIHYAPTFGTGQAAFDFVIDGQCHQKVMKASLTVNNADAYLAACLAGLGIIQIPVTGIVEKLRNNELIEFLPQLRAAPMPITLLYPNRRHLPKRTQVFMNWIANLVKSLSTVNTS